MILNESSIGANQVRPGSGFGGTSASLPRQAPSVDGLNAF